MPGVTRELDNIFLSGRDDRGIIGGEVVSDKSFTREAFFRELGKGRPVVHIASHFAFRPGDSSRSYLLLGNGEALTLSEMQKRENLFQGVELLTLSACNTAATRADANGREIDGFAELAQRLGAGAVMATLWAVADESTALLMSEFYRQKKKNPKMTKAEAIQRVQRAMIEGKLTKTGKKKADRGEIDERFSDRPNLKKFEFDAKKPYAHPYFWSPFVLIGNWK